MGGEREKARERGENGKEGRVGRQRGREEREGTGNAGIKSQWSRGVTMGNPIVG